MALIEAIKQQQHNGSLAWLNLAPDDFVSGD
jgi:hypothetical protein